MPTTSMLELHAREKIGATESWTIFRWECIPPDDDTQVYRLTGALEIQGKRGRRTWPKPHVKIYITPPEHKMWIDEWEKRTRKCGGCAGFGSEFASWSATEGTKTRNCSKCHGTGVPQNVDDDHQ